MLSGLWDMIEGLAVAALNAIIAALGAVLEPLVELLPEMPALPSMPDGFVTAYGWVAWFFPVGTVLDILAFTLTVWLLWSLVVIALRWAKAANA